MTIRKVSAGALENGSITAAKLASNSVETAKVAALNITSAKIGTGAVDAPQLNTGAVTTAKIADLGVTTAKIATGAVSSDKFADGSITTAKIADSHVTTAKIADLAVTTGKIGTGAVEAANINTGAVTTAKIADDGVTNAKLTSAAAKTVKGNNGTSTGAISDVAISALTAGLLTFAPSGASAAQGLVPSPGTTTGTRRFLREDGDFELQEFEGVASAYVDAPGTDGVETVVFTASVPAASVPNDNDWVEVFVAGTIITTANTPELKMYVDGIEIYSSGALSISDDTKFTVRGHVFRDGTATFVACAEASLSVGTAGATETHTTITASTTTGDWGSGRTIEFTSNCATGADVTLNVGHVKAFKI